MEIGFLSIFYPMFTDLCNFIQLWKITPLFYNNLFGFGRGEASPPPAGAHDFFAYFSINLTNHALIFCAFGRKMQIVEN